MKVALRRGGLAAFALRRGRLAALVVVTALATASCWANFGASPATEGPSAPPPTTSTGGSFPPSPVDGVLVDIESASLSEVFGFDLRLPDGTILAFTIGPLENAAEFPPGHLSEHQATGAPVRVSYRIIDGVPVVYRLEDAPP
ncbi:MAG TPA: hypothetical protein VEX41_06880 [Candidatus Eisenbacteria bacterium]|nr:hypothetical protein [Candidatus Eisenbacteria bacterium]